MVEGVLILGAGVLPMVVYALVLWWFDRYEKEPIGLLAVAFLWGAVPAVIFSAIVELVVEGTSITAFARPATAELIEAAVVAPATEESFKGLALLLLVLFYRREIDSLLDGIIYGGLVGFGFAAVENVFYFLSAWQEAGLGGVAMLVLFRAFLFGLNHALFTGLVGLGVALVRLGSHPLMKVAGPVGGLVLGVGAHAVHNASVTLGAELIWPCLIAFASDWGGVLILFVIVMWTSIRERRWVVDFLEDETEQGTLSRDDYHVISSYLKRLAVRTRALLRGDVKRWWNLGRYHRLATELAFEKRHLTRFPEDERTRECVEQLRDRVRKASGRVAV